MKKLILVDILLIVAGWCLVLSDKGIIAVLMGLIIDGLLLELCHYLRFKNIPVFLGFVLMMAVALLNRTSMVDTCSFLSSYYLLSILNLCLLFPLLSYFQQREIYLIICFYSIICLIFLLSNIVIPEELLLFTRMEMHLLVGEIFFPLLFTFGYAYLMKELQTREFSLNLNKKKVY